MAETPLFNEAFSLDDPKEGAPRLRLVKDDGGVTHQDRHQGVSGFRCRALQPAGSLVRPGGVTAVWLWVLGVTIVMATIAAVAGSEFNVLSQLNSLPRIPSGESDPRHPGGIITAIAAVVAAGRSSPWRSGRDEVPSQGRPDRLRLLAHRQRERRPLLPIR